VSCSEAIWIDARAVQVPQTTPRERLRDSEPMLRYYRGGKDRTTRRGGKMRARDDVTMAVEIHADAVLRACAVYLREKADREDAFQETFVRYARSNKTFRSEEHRKAWLIRVAINICKDMLKRASSRVDSLDAALEQGVAVMGDDGMEGQRELENEGLLAALGQLEERYRTVLYLKYYEGYTAAQIAAITGMPENTVYTNLSRGKRQLLGVIQGG